MMYVSAKEKAVSLNVHHRYIEDEGKGRAPSLADFAKAEAMLNGGGPVQVESS
jgi:hypothetical protein